MTDEDISAIEDALGFSLPPSYIAVVSRYPADLIDTEAPDFALFNNPKNVISRNIDIRENGFFGEPWPNHYVIIGENGCGDFYVITTNATEFSVGFADHETMECTQFAFSLEDFIAKLRSEMNGG